MLWVVVSFRRVEITAKMSVSRHQADSLFPYNEEDFLSSDAAQCQRNVLLVKFPHNPLLLLYFGSKLSGLFAFYLCQQFKGSFQK